MAGGGFGVEQVDPVLNVMSRLEQARRQAEAGSLAADAWARLYDDETALEDGLLEQTEVLTAVADLGGAARIWSIVAEFNERLGSIIEIIIEHPPADYPSSEELAKNKKACAKLSAYARAQASLMAAVNHRLTGNLSEAEVSARDAQQRFESLANEGAEGSALASIQASMADGLRLGITAAAKQLRFQYHDASVTYLQAQKVMERVRARLIQSKDTTAVQLAGVLNDIYEYKSAAERALLLKAIVDGDFEKAAAHADAMVKIAAPPDDGILPPWVAQSAKMNQCNAASYLAYAKAELAANSRDWDEAERQLTDAEEQWRQLVAIAIDIDIPQSRQVAESVQAISTQTIASTRRRIKRERSLYEQIAQVQAENEQLQNQIYQLAKEPRFGGSMNIRKSDESIHIGGNVTGAQVGRNNKQIIENSFNEFSAAHGKEDDLAAQMQILKDSITELVTELQSQDANAAAEVTDTFQSFAEESAKDDPKAGTLRVLGKALIDSAKKVAKVAAPIASAVATIITIFGIPPI